MKNQKAASILRSIDDKQMKDVAGGTVIIIITNPGPTPRPCTTCGVLGVVKAEKV